MEHTRKICNPKTDRCDDGRCNVCDLYVCAVCNGAEGSLLPECPGRFLSYDEDQRNYIHYCAQTGPFTKETS